MAVTIVSPALLVLAVLGAYSGGNVGSLAYVASLGMSASIVLIVSIVQGGRGVGWRIVGVGLTVWAITGCLVTLNNSANLGAPDLLTSLGYAFGYVPVMIGLAVLGDNGLRVRRMTNFIDGVIVLLVLYGLVWLLVVEPVDLQSTLGRMDRAFEALYPAGDLAVLMLAVRVVAGRTMHRRVVGLLLVGSAMSAAADIGLLVGYLANPDGSFPITDLIYLAAMSVIALAAMASMQTAPPAVDNDTRSWRWVPIVVAASATLPPLGLLGVSLVSDREISVPAVAVWLLAMVATMVARSLAGVREVERVHRHSTWLASHDLPTGMLRRSAFLHEVSEGTLRDRSGTVIMVEVQAVRELADRHGFEASESLLDTVAFRMRTVTGPGAVLARMGHDQFVAFLRSVDSGHGRQVAAGVQKALLEPVAFADEHVPLVAAVGVSQADGAVIDVLAGVRRATEAMHHARSLGAGGLAFDADLAGTAGF